MAYNLVTLSATVDSDIQHIDLGSGKYVALFKVKYYSARQPCTITIAAFDNVTDYVEKALREGSEILIKGNLTQYNDETEIIANSIDSYDASGRVVSSVKKESRKEWANAATRDKGSAPDSATGESSNEQLLERIAKLEKMLSDGGKSHKS